MAGTTLDLMAVIEPELMGTSIATKWQEWHSYRRKWISEKKELRNYVFATDTTTTTNNQLEWSNSTTTPKLTQIYDNLKANYTAALFPNADWMKWEGGDEEGDARTKAETIQSYMMTKLKQSEFADVADSLIDDWVLYGNCFATVEWAEEVHTLDEGDTHPVYIGPRLRRISPYDIVMNPTASSFEKSPKIIRSLLSLGEVRRMVEAGGNDHLEQVFTKMLANRREAAGATSIEKSDAFVADGFNSIELYYASDYVELLTFYGDIYDTNDGSLKERMKITVADRAYVIKEEKIASWLGTSPVFHSGWRGRPDNLWAMGPLDNLVGMQYRIDHLENLKADVFDQIAYPILKIRGDVEHFTYAPGTQIQMGEEGDVVALSPDTTALNADLQIQQLERKMEELAGAPSVAMGIRTPGEKTAFEVNSLQNASGRIFQHKAEKMERQFWQKVLNGMLAAARENMDASDTIRVMDNQIGVGIFETITRADIKGNGLITPLGASHFAERALRVQNLQQLQVLKQDPTIGVHLSGKKIAEILSLELGEKELYGENIAVHEQLATQSAGQEAEAQNAENLALKAEQGL